MCNFYSTSRVWGGVQAAARSSAGTGAIGTRTKHMSQPGVHGILAPNKLRQLCTQGHTKPGLLLPSPQLLVVHPGAAQWRLQMRPAWHGRPTTDVAAQALPGHPEWNETKKSERISFLKDVTKASAPGNGQPAPAARFCWLRRTAALGVGAPRLPQPTATTPCCSTPC